MPSGAVVENVSNIGNVEELQKILLVASKLHESQQVNILLEQIKIMEQNQTMILQEIADLRKQINEIQGKQANNSVVSGQGESRCGKFL